MSTNEMLGVIFSEMERKVLIEALNLLHKEELKKHNFYEWGTVEKSNSIRKLEAIEQLRDKIR